MGFNIYSHALHSLMSVGTILMYLWTGGNGSESFILVGHGHDACKPTTWNCSEVFVLVGICQKMAVPPTSSVKLVKTSAFTIFTPNAENHF